MQRHENSFGAEMNTTIKLVCVVLVWSISLWANADEFSDTVMELNAKSYSAKRKAIEAVQLIDDPRTLTTLKAMSDGVLFYYPAENTLVIGEETEEGAAITDVISEQSLGVVNENLIDKIKINNSVRGKLRTAIASIQLTSKNKALRVQSARDLVKKPDEDLREIIAEAIKLEESHSVKDEMEVALAMIDIEADDTVLRTHAVEILSSSVAPEAVAALARLAKKDENGKFEEEDKALAALANKGLEKVESRISFYKVIENFFFGISLGSVLLLAAVGLAITFGVMGVINMAHGEMIMLGAYTTFALQQLFPGLMQVSVLLAIPCAFMVSGSVGVLIERTVIRHLYGRPLETLLATFGISLILQQAVRTYNANNVPVEAPTWMSGFYQFNGALAFTYNRLYIIIFSLMVLAGLALLLRKTMVGLQMRAVTQNRAMANSMGIRSSWVDALTFGLGSGIAGIAGVALSQITNVGPNMGQNYIIDSFMVVVFGGVGNLLGTFFAAISLGVINKFLEPFSGAVLGKIIVLVFIILFIQWRPRGLFALKGRFVED